MPGRIFTNEPINESPTWLAQTASLPLEAEGSGAGRIVRAWHNARLTHRHTAPNDLVIFSDSHNLSGSLYGLLRNGQRPRPTFVRTDPLLTPGRLGPMNSSRTAYLRAALRTVDRIIVWAPAVIDRYVQHFGIPRQKMVAQRFHHTIQGYHFDDVVPGGYIFSGGDSMRDYRTLIDAVRGLSTPVFIATRRKLEQHIALPPNVTVQAVSHEQFRQRMAAAALIVFPLRMDNIRTSGQQSYLSAMAMGKPVIVTDITDAPYYIDHGKTGMLTPPGDSAALRSAIRRVIEDRDLAHELGQAARTVALPMDQEYTWSNVLRLAIEACDARGTAESAPLAPADGTCCASAAAPPVTIPLRPAQNDCGTGPWEPGSAMGK